MSLNSVTLHGRVGSDPEIKRFDGGGVVANMSFATSDKMKNASGEYQEITDWHNLTCWGKLAELIEKHIKKGKELVVSGKIKTQTWEKDGQKKYRTYILVSNIDFCGSKKDDNAQSNAGRIEPEQQEEEDDLPF